MYKQIAKKKDNGIMAIFQRKGGLGLVDNRKESIGHHSMSLFFSATYGSNIIQLAKILPLQNKVTPTEKEDIENGARINKAEILWDWDPNGIINIGDDEPLYIVTHGNTSSIGDANEGEKYNIDYTPHHAATLLNRMLPQTYKGKIWLWACHGSEIGAGGLSVADAIMTNLSRMRKSMEGMRSMEMLAFAGAVDGNMDLRTTRTTINKKDILAYKKLTRYQYVRGLNRNRLGNKKIWERENSNLNKRLSYSKLLYEKKLKKANSPKDKLRLIHLYRAQWMKSRSKNQNKMEDF
ncbi:hypothetical protein [Enterobacter sp. ECC-019]|uniref:hypothetical protein n=1 Tax=Enterobacter sp. ECC-019 TaxID=3116478 RepID=UPI00375443CB